jgi:hypothetical protein
MSALESCAQLATELSEAREKLRPLLALASQLGGLPTLNNLARLYAQDVDKALDELVREIGNIARDLD